MKTTNHHLLKYLEKSPKNKEVKLKTPMELQRLLDVTKRMLNKAFLMVQDNSQLPDFDISKERDNIAKLIQLINVLEKDKFEGYDRKVQIKPLKYQIDPETGEEKVCQALFILKWGGELTYSGVRQAE